MLFLTLQFGFVFEKMASILSSPVFVNSLQKIACVENEIKQIGGTILTNSVILLGDGFYKMNVQLGVMTKVCGL